MIFRFNINQLGRFQRESLQRILDVIQSHNENEIEVDVDQVVCADFSCDNFLRYSVKNDFGELFVCWNFVKSVFTITRKEDALCILNEKVSLLRSRIKSAL